MTSIPLPSFKVRVLGYMNQRPLSGSIKHGVLEEKNGEFFQVGNVGAGRE